MLYKGEIRSFRLVLEVWPESHCRFRATPSRRIPVLFRVVVHIIHCNTHYFIDNRR